jgi:hypothetical protein
MSILRKKIKIKTEKLEVLAELNDSKIAQLIFDALPIKAEANTWGDEIYFPIPVKAKIDNPKDVVEKGDLGYWPDGACFCIFFGKTPISDSEDKIIPASSVEIIGKIVSTEDITKFKQVNPGEKIILERIING